MSKNCFRLIVPVLSLLLLHSAAAQSGAGRGSLSGTVADAVGDALPGARVTLDPGGVTAVADGQGDFLVSNLAPGSYTIKVEALGFEPYTHPVTITSISVIQEHAVLKISSAQENVQVYAGREKGEMEAMNEQQSSDNILEVLPADVINSLPNTNIADAVGRLPGVSLERDEGEGKYVQIRGTEPRLSNLTVDGINIPSPESSVRNIKLDVIPAELVGSIDVSKTLTPNQDGDAIGGSVNLTTRSAGDRPFLSISGMGGHSPIILAGQSNIDQFTLAAGKRFGANKRLGVFIGGSYDYNRRGIDDIEPAPGTAQLNGAAATDPFYVVLPTADYREYHYDRTRYGFAGTVDYQFSPGTVLFVRGLFSDFQDYGGKWIYTPTVNSWDTPNTSSDPANNFTYTDSPRFPDYQIGNLSATFSHATGSWLIAATAAISHSRADNQDFPSAGFQGPSGMSFNVDRSNPYRPKFNILSYANPTDNIHDPTQYTITGITLTKDHSAQLNLQGSLDVTRTYNWNGHMGTWQAGAKLRNAHKFNDVDDTSYSPNSDSGLGPFTLADVQGTYRTSDYYNGTYDYYTKGRTSDWNAILAKLNANMPAFSPSSSPYTFNLHEMIPAQYFMTTINVGRMRYVAGLRLEETVSDFFTTNSQLGKKTSTYLDFMPNAQVRWSLNNNSDIRVVYGRGIARPNYGDLVPQQTFNGTKNQVSEGNPNLLPTRANNFDILGEHYFNTVGVLQAGFFFKQISNPIVTTQHIIPVGQLHAGFVDSQPINLPSAHIGGIELAWEQHFKSLPGALHGLGIFANYGYSFSQARYSWVYHDENGNPISASDNRALPRQAPNTFNVNPTFDLRHLTARFGISYNQANIYAYNWTGVPGDSTVNGPKGPTGDNYLYSHTQYDAELGYTLPYGFKLTASGLNLSNEVFGFYQGSTQYPIQREYYHPTYSFALRWTSNVEK
jgi:TonB-dependent receptor